MSNNYTILANDPDPLFDVVTVNFMDRCDVTPPEVNCNPTALTDTAGSSTNILVCEVSINVAKRCDLNDVFIDDLLTITDSDGTGSCTSIDGLDVEHFTEVQNTGDVDLQNCVYTDDAPTLSANLAFPGGSSFSGTQGGECSALEGTMTATVTCDCVGSDSLTATATDTAAIDCVNCAAEVDKTVACGDSNTFGESCLSWLPSADTDPELVKVDFDVTDNSEAGASLTNCRLDDSNSIIDADIGSGTISTSGKVHQFSQDCSEALVIAENVTDTATLTCDCEVDADTDIVSSDHVIDMDDAGFDCHAAGVMLSKVCQPLGEGGVAPNQSKVTVTASNVGDQDAGTTDAILINCVVTDTLARDDDNCANVAEDVDLGVLADDFDLNPAGDEMFMAVIDGLTMSSCNEAAVTCNIDDGTGEPVMEGGQPKEITKTVTDQCEAGIPGCFPYTLGFWSNRAPFVNAVGEIMVCGQTLDGAAEVAPLLCDRGQEILNAQCAAAALGAAASNSPAGMGSCMPDAEGDVGALLAVCCDSDGNGGCGPMNGSGLSQSDCIEQVSEFNEAEPTLDCFEIGPGADLCSPGAPGSKTCSIGGGGGPKPPKPPKICNKKGKPAGCVQPI